MWAAPSGSPGSLRLLHTSPGTEPGACSGGRLAWDEMSAPGSRGGDDILTAHGDAPPLSYLKQDPRLPASEAEAGVSGVILPPPQGAGPAPPHPHPPMPGSELGLHPVPRL